jgi:hypothetical protein
MFRGDENPRHTVPTVMWDRSALRRDQPQRELGASGASSRAIGSILAAEPLRRRVSGITSSAPGGVERCAGYER